MLTVDQCKHRQRRLLEVMERERLDAVVVGWQKHAYWLCGHWPFWLHQTAAVLFADGRSVLVTANQPPKSAAADEIRTYVANWMGTQRPHQPELAAAVALEALASRPVRRLGIDTSAVSLQVARGFDGGRGLSATSADARAAALDGAPAREGGGAPDNSITMIDAALLQLRRIKHADELELMKKAMACCGAMYRRARAIIEPGVPELRVFADLTAAAIEAAGEPLSDLLGNDYACGAPGGPARGGRAAKAGELYILDLGPAYRGYFSDNCRAIAVDRRPTDAQLSAWEGVREALGIVESMARPGVRCVDLFEAVNQHLLKHDKAGMSHHLGHGVGLEPHEFPHLNPRWDDVLLEGEVFTAEPGIYRSDLAAGLRLENQYLVTAAGVTNLTPFGLELA